MITYDAAEKWLAKRISVATQLGSGEIAAIVPEQVRMQSFFSARVAVERIPAPPRIVVCRSRASAKVVSPRA